MKELQKVRHVTQRKRRMKEKKNHFDCSDGEAK